MGTSLWPRWERRCRGCWVGGLRWFLPGVRGLGDQGLPSVCPSAWDSPVHFPDHPSLGSSSLLFEGLIARPQPPLGGPTPTSPAQNTSLLAPRPSSELFQLRASSFAPTRPAPPWVCHREAEGPPLWCWVCAPGTASPSQLPIPAVFGTFILLRETERLVVRG